MLKAIDMQKNEIWTEYKVSANDYQRFIFSVNENQRGFKVIINSNIRETDKNVIYTFFAYEEFQKWENWFKTKLQQKRDSSGKIVKNSQGFPVYINIPAPQIRTYFDLKTNMIERTLLLDQGTYVLMFNNIYSTINAKNIWLHIIETWDEEVPSEDLPIIEHLIDDLPADVATCVLDANNCFTSGHYNQCTVMLRKTIEIASKIKLQQSGVKTEEMLDEGGDDISLSRKLKLLKKYNLITRRNVSDFEDVKWFGDKGVHSTMQVTFQDIKDNVEPKIRSFLVGLNLKS